MKRLLKYLLTAAAVCLCFALGATPKGTKKFAIKGHVEGQIVEVAPDLSWFKTVEVDIGESTFFGRYSNLVYATYHADGSAEAYGTAVGANGKGTVNWTLTGDGVNATTTITSGTGIYKDISGFFNATVSNLNVDFKALTDSYDYTGTGEVTSREK